MDFVLGADGCRLTSSPSGSPTIDAWAAVELRADGSAHPHVFTSTRELWSFATHARLVLLDVPIGLPETGPRACDGLARKLLGPRAASVFPAPERWMLACATLGEADAEKSRRVGRPAKVQRQMWNLMPRIRAVDELMLRDARARDLIAECHPELCWRGLNAGAPLSRSKHTPEGLNDRRRLILGAIPEAREIERTLLESPGLAPDDALDALACAWAAAAWLTDSAERRTIPDAPSLDAAGLPMRMLWRERSPR